MSIHMPAHMSTHMSAHMSVARSAMMALPCCGILTPTLRQCTNSAHVPSSQRCCAPSGPCHLHKNSSATRVYVLSAIILTLDGIFDGIFGVRRNIRLNIRWDVRWSARECSMECAMECSRRFDLSFVQSMECANECSRSFDLSFENNAR